MVNLYRKLPEGKRKLLQVSGRFELASVRVIGGLLEKGERSWPCCPKNGRAVKYNHFEQKNIASAEKKFLILLLCNGTCFSVPNAAIANLVPRAFQGKSPGNEVGRSPLFEGGAYLHLVSQYIWKLFVIRSKTQAYATRPKASMGIGREQPHAPNTKQV